MWEFNRPAPAVRLDMGNHTSVRLNAVIQSNPMGLFRSLGEGIWSPILISAALQTSLQGSGRAAARVVAMSLATTMGRSMARRVVSRVRPVFAVLVRWQSLDQAVPGKHSTVHRKVPADHERPHRGVFLGKFGRLVSDIGLVLAAIHVYQGSEALIAVILLVSGTLPTTSNA